MIQQNLLTKALQLVLTVALVGLMILLGAGLIPLPHFFPPPTARAAGTINVTTTGDEYGSGSGCSLREAIESINTNSSFGGCSNPSNAADTIQIQADTYTLSIHESGFPFDNAQGGLQPEKSMNIRGAGSGQTIITATTAFNAGVFKVCSDDLITIENITIQGIKDGSSAIGGCATNPNLTLILTDIVIENNQGNGVGCLICNLNLNGVTIRNNQSGGLGFYAGGNITLNNVTLHGNQGFYGGAIQANSYSNPAMLLQMTNVTIYDNQAQYSGGGLYLSFSGSGSVVTATNVTIVNNRAISGTGGNIYNYASTLSLKNTIIANGLANGSPNNCAGNPVPNITSLGYNLDSGNTCGLTATGDITNTNPLLAASLADNGGSTQTLALLSGSPAIDKIPAGVNGCGSNPTTDQRGVTRPQGGYCDIGAYEAELQSSYYYYLPIILKRDASK